jgi:hypothetical protein
MKIVHKKGTTEIRGHVYIEEIISIFNMNSSLIYIIDFENVENGAV